MALMTNDVTSLRVALGLGVMIVVDIILYSILGSIILIQKIDFMLALKIMTPVIFINFYTRPAFTKETTSGSNYI